MLTPPVRAPDFPDGLDWIHTGGRPISVRDLRGRVALLDFWTYGCINCIHVLPHLRELERRFGDRLVVIGVHSGKYLAERVPERIREASIRLGATHPIVNDRQFRIWRAYAVRGWPTAVLIDARGRVVATRGGEFTAELLAPVIERLIAESGEVGGGDGIGAPPPTYLPERPALAPGALRYPGKVAGERITGGVVRLAVSDTGHHRVLVGALRDGGRRLAVTHVVGCGEPGLVDGPLDAARLTAPQGVALDGDTLFVADAGNHAVRRVDLADGVVRTIAGTGARVMSQEERRAGALASPWSVAMSGGELYVAMAGTHQLLAMRPDGSRPRVHAGQGGEELRDDLLERALLAQPMGLAAAGDHLWFADAESSAVRRAGTGRGGRVDTAVGTGLFDFGDRDGVGDEVRLQHPQDVAVHPGTGRVLVCDTYNDALRWLDPVTRRVESWVRGLHEPGGVAILGDHAYVADTNAHRVVAVHVDTGAVEEVVIEPPTSSPVSGWWYIS
ncbi:MAG TPA: thioredoxin-like domain-containing protein [Gemmatimonadales bacterium]